MEFCFKSLLNFVLSFLINFLFVIGHDKTKNFIIKLKKKKLVMVLKSPTFILKFKLQLFTVKNRPQVNKKNGS